MHLKVPGPALRRDTSQTAVGRTHAIGDADAKQAQASINARGTHSLSYDI